MRAVGCLMDWDAVVHSTTKYLNGHSDVVGGAVLTSDVELCDKLRTLLNQIEALSMQLHRYRPSVATGLLNAAGLGS